jgi:3-deoxy-D-manno-octulosonic-acid transferase
MTYLIVWTAVAAACALYAQQRGRPGALWFLLGLILSFFALFMLWLLEPIDEAASRAVAGRLGISSNHRRCPACHGVVTIHSRSCGHCHVALLPLALD